MRRAPSSERIGNTYAASVCLLVEKEKKNPNYIGSYWVFFQKTRCSRTVIMAKVWMVIMVKR